jgi:DNA-directed RNA polymerase specialized sigma24 family protein
MIKEYLKNYRGYRDLVKHLDGRIALRVKLGEYPEEDLGARNHFEHLVAGIDCALGRLSDPDEQRLLRLRYVEGWSWTKVSLSIHYSRSQTKRIHARALEHLEEITKRDGLLWEE